MTALRLLAFLLLLALPAAAADPAAELVGRWKHESTVMTVTTTFLADGRYHAEIKIGETSVPERGRFTVKGKEIHFEPTGSLPIKCPYTLGKDNLVITSSGLPMKYRRIGSAADVAAEAKAADAGKAVEDDEWRKKFTVSRPEKLPATGPVAGIPKDENPGRVFERPTVFDAHQLYVQTGNVKYVFPRNDPPGTFQSTFKWHFLPTGRVFVDAVTYRGGVKSERDRPGFTAPYLITGKTENRKFGRYTVGKDEALTIELDDGEKIAASFIDGRRNLKWDAEVYGNVVWELEALKRAGAAK